MPDAGGCYVFCDTDSLAHLRVKPSFAQGEQVARMPSFDEVKRDPVAVAFLNPYDRRLRHVEVAHDCLQRSLLPKVEGARVVAELRR